MQPTTTCSVEMLRVDSQLLERRHDALPAQFQVDLLDVMGKNPYVTPGALVIDGARAHPDFPPLGPAPGTDLLDR